MRCCATVGDRAARAGRSTTPPSARRWASWRREQAVRDERLALRVPDARGGAARARAGAVGDRDSWCARGSRRSCRRCSCASRRWRRPASSPPTAPRSTRSTDDELFLVGTSEVPLSALHRGEILAADVAAAALRSASRRTSGARPAPTARTRAASSACTSSTRSRCSRTPIPRRRGTSTRRSSRSRSRSSAGSGCRTAS